MLITKCPGKGCRCALYCMASEAKGYLELLITCPSCNRPLKFILCRWYCEESRVYYSHCTVCYKMVPICGEGSTQVYQTFLESLTCP